MRRTTSPGARWVVGALIALLGGGAGYPAAPRGSSLARPAPDAAPNGSTARTPSAPAEGMRIELDAAGQPLAVPSGAPIPGGLPGPIPRGAPLLNAPGGGQMIVNTHLHASAAHLGGDGRLVVDCVHRPVGSAAALPVPQGTHETRRGMP